MFLLLFLSEMEQKYKLPPSGNISNAIVIAGKTTKLIFFMFCTSFVNSDFAGLFASILSHNRIKYKNSHRGSNYGGC